MHAMWEGPEGENSSMRRMSTGSTPFSRTVELRY